MLEELRIQDLGVIESSTLELGPGLTVLTGETGAGKTMVVTALGLLLGGRADSSAVRTGARTARVEGIVAPGDDGEFEAVVDEVGGEVEDGRVVLARNVSAEGRSRAFVGGAGVPVSGLAEVTSGLVAVHGQSDQHRLLRPAAQREALDRFAGPEVTGLLEQHRTLHRELTACEAELRDVLDHARERAREADLLRFGVAEVEALAPQPGEDATLAAEESRLGFAESLRTAAQTAREILSSDAGEGDALTALAAARAQMDAVREHDPEAAGLADRLGELTYVLSDLASDVASYASGLESDPTRLAAVSERRAALSGLTRKYGESVDEVLTWAAGASDRLLELDGTDERVEHLRQRSGALRVELADVAQALTEARVRAAHRLGAEVTAELSALAMPHALLTVQVNQRDSSPGDRTLEVGGRTLRLHSHGVDEVELLLAANTGSEPRPLGKGASGGELSRVMLALEVALAGTSPVPTFVFDEVDAGVGGKAAVEVGRRLAMLARASQVLVVTHLPQVAAYADRHVVVEKSSDGSITTSGLTTLDDEARVRELGRMLAGVEESESALAHARELLEAARTV